MLMNRFHLLLQPKKLWRWKEMEGREKFVVGKSQYHSQNPPSSPPSIRLVELHLNPYYWADIQSKAKQITYQETNEQIETAFVSQALLMRERETVWYDLSRKILVHSSLTQVFPLHSFLPFEIIFFIFLHRLNHRMPSKLFDWFLLPQFAIQ